MVIVKVAGGIGNQFFQYAFGQELKEKYGYCVKYDLSYFSDIPKGDTPRTIEIGDLLEENEIATLKEKKLCCGYNNILFRVLKRLGVVERRIYYEELEGETCQCDAFTDNSYVIGYWQSFQYFSSVSEYVYEKIWWLLEKNLSHDIYNNYAEMIDNTESVSVHVRGGDYLDINNLQTYGGICTTLYYEKAIRRIQKDYPGATFFLFTNDEGWVKRERILEETNMVIVSKRVELSDMEELCLMAKCKHHIIANSSFSWWGAWLGMLDKRGMVIAPNKWTNNSHDAKIYVDGWIRI